jgi:hypothetical protein
MSFNDYEFQRLEKFVTQKSKLNTENFTGAIRNYIMSLRHRYFEFIPKDSVIKSTELIKLTVDLKAIEKNYNLKSYIVGFNFLYFALLLDKRKRIFSFNMLVILGLTNIIILIQQFYFYHRITQALDPLLSKDIEQLYQSLKRERQGFNKKVESIFIIRQ